MQRPGLSELLANLAWSAADPEGSVGGVEKKPWSFFLQDVAQGDASADGAAVSERLQEPLANMAAQHEKDAAATATKVGEAALEEGAANGGRDEADSLAWVWACTLEEGNKLGEEAFHT